MSVIYLIWVCVVAVTVSWGRAAFHPMPKLRVIDRSREFTSQQKTVPKTQVRRKTKSVTTRGLGDDFLKEYYDKDAEGHGGFTTLVSPEFETLTFETDEIRETVDFIEFKMSEINALMKECIARHFTFDPMADLADVKLDCVGNSFQILTMSYQEGMRRVKDVLIELVRLKLPQLSERMNEEVEFFVDLMEQLVDSDFKIEETLAVAKRASKYYVSPRLFDRIILYAQAEIMAFAAIQGRLKGARNDVQKSLEDFHVSEEDEVRKLEQLDNSHTRKWNKNQVFRKLGGSAEYVGNFAHRPVSAQAQKIQGKVDHFLDSKKGGQVLGDLIRKNRFE